jgi:hypothetical protein
MLLHVNSELYDDISKRVKETNGEELGQCFVLLVHLRRQTRHVKLPC